MSNESEGSWQPDPDGMNDYRWHDGTAFTQHVANGELVGTAPLGERDPKAPPRNQGSPVQMATNEEAAVVSGNPGTAGNPSFATTDSGHSIVNDHVHQYTGGITGDLLGTGDADAMVREVDVVNGRFLRCFITGTPMVARQGAMVGYQGNVDFDYQSQGMGNLFKKALTGEGVPLMRMSGHGEVYLAQQAQKVHVIHLNNAALSINGSNVLAFSGALHYNIEMIRGGAVAMAAGGLVNTVFKGTGWLAFSTDGDPLVLDATKAPTFADTNALVGWSAGLQATLKSTFKAGALIGRGSGELFQAQFSGQGFVIIQPSEGIYQVTQ
ncbi:AIM24 family protein [Stomatohabitans albus]|uniref:AIM24 family protein n=1 Tax=Stomatohabitans albus TaxID=3110766 RepID=UPI00300CD2AF